MVDPPLKRRVSLSYIYVSVDIGVKCTAFKENLATAYFLCIILDKLIKILNYEIQNTSP